MKLLLFFLTVWSSSLSAQQSTAVINDSDGYTNIRSTKDPNSDIVGKIKKGERFKYQTDNGQWWSVEDKNGIKGFMHRSRIKPLDAIECGCFFNKYTGVSYDKLALVAQLADDNRVSVCGYLEEKLSEKEIKISEFEIFDCAMGESLAEYGALDRCRVSAKNHQLIITGLSFLPVGDDWEFRSVPDSERIIEAVNWQIKVHAPQPVLEIPNIPKERIEKFLQFLRAQKGKGFGLGWEENILKLLVTALTGNQEAKYMLLHLEEYFGFTADGAIAETYRDALATYRWVGKSKSD